MAEEKSTRRRNSLVLITLLFTLHAIRSLLTLLSY